MRLRPLSEAECYARCYGGHRGDRVSLVQVRERSPSRPSELGESLRLRFEQGLEAVSRHAVSRRAVSRQTAPRPRPHDEGLPHVDGAPSTAGDGGQETGTTPSELMDLHGDVDAGRATLQAAWPQALLTPTFPTSSRTA